MNAISQAGFVASGSSHSLGERQTIERFYSTMRRFESPHLQFAIMLLAVMLLAAMSPAVPAQSPPQVSGIYPHLAMFNNENECGTGAVVPWAGRLWVVTYAPHAPQGSSDKLYELTSDLKQIIRPESVGGTPANRMIHRESQQLFIGPYVIDARRNVRVIPPQKMFGRLTANARHLTDPANKIYFATMEEGLYEVDVHRLTVKTLFFDEAIRNGSPHADLPGYHGKGLYSGQGRLIYANNGEHGRRAQIDPTIPSGVLAQWSGKGDWQIVQRHQFTEVTGPGGIAGNNDPARDPVWSIGWDARSLILMVLDRGAWYRYRLPKASHCYDGAHGWNTEWPRIRDIGEDDLLMTMHGMFWRFPKTFSPGHSAGIRPRSTYLKVVGDFCRWQDRIVLGCDDTAKSEFLNRRRAKGTLAAPQSQSNLWFLKPEQLDQLGPVIGHGAVWLDEPVVANEPSDPFLIGPFKQRGVHLVTDQPATLTLEIDRTGNGDWSPLEAIPVDGHHWYAIAPDTQAVWIRVRSDRDLERGTVLFDVANPDHRPRSPLGSGQKKFSGLARLGQNAVVGGLLWARDGNRRTLQFAAEDADGKIGVYVLDDQLKLTKCAPDENDQDWRWMQSHVAIPDRKGVLSVDSASVIYTDEEGNRFRLPRHPDHIQPGPLGFGRLCREVATERDLLNCHGTFYELPAKNAGGFKRIRPIASHPFRMDDYCSYRGLLVISGIAMPLDDREVSKHLIVSNDRRAALWVGAVDDLWELGKPVGTGGPWLNTEVAANRWSDPYLMNGYDHKTLTLASDREVEVEVEIDITGTGDWQPYRSFHLTGRTPIRHSFPPSFGAWWIRFRSRAAARLTAQLRYQ